MTAPSNIRSMRDAETFNESASRTVSHYARGFGMLAGMIETMRLADRLGRPDEVRIALDKALEFIAEHDGKAPVLHIRQQDGRRVCSDAEALRGTTF